MIQMKETIQQLYSDYKVYVDNSKEQLQLLLRTVTEGKRPDDESILKLDETISELQKQYTSLVEFVKGSIDPSELPGDGSSIQQYVDAFESSRSAMLDELLSNAKNTLQVFINVRSLVSMYSQALSPYQVKAQELLSSIEENPESIDFDELQKQVDGPESFIKALSYDNYETEESMESLEKITENFSQRIAFGVSMKKYHLAEEASSTSMQEQPSEDETNPENLPLLTTPSIEKQNNKTLNQGQNDYTSLTDESVSIDGDASTNIEIVDSSQTDENESDNLSVEVEESLASDETELANQSVRTFKEHMEAHNGYVTDDDFMAESFSEYNIAAEQKKLSSSVFVNDMKNGSRSIPSSYRYIIEQLTGNGQTVTDESFAAYFRDYPENTLQNSFTYLFNKGYLRKYGLQGLGMFYMASPRLWKALTYKEAAKSVIIHQNKTGLTLPNSVEDRSFIALNVSRCNILRDRFVYYNADGTDHLGNFKETIGENAFICRMTDEEVGYCELFLGAFWKELSNDDCVIFLERLVDMIATIDKVVSTVIITGINKEKAKCLASAVNVSLGNNFDVDTIYLYSLQENKYYRYSNMEPIDPLSIVPLLSETEFSEDNDNSDDLSDSFEAESMPNKSESDEVVSSDLSDPVSLCTEQSVNPAIEENLVSEDDNNTSIEPETPEQREISEKSEFASRDLSSRLNNLYSLLISGMPYAAMAYAKSELAKTEQAKLIDLLSYALHDPAGHCVYSTDNVFDLISQDTLFEESLVISMAARTFFSKQVNYDYNLRAFYDGIKENNLLKRFSSLSKAVFSMMEFKDGQKTGLDAFADYHAKDRNKLKADLLNVQREASTFYNNFIIGQPRENAKQRRFLDTKRMLFAPDGDIGQYLKAICDNDKEIQPLVIDFLLKNFIKESESISVDAVSQDKLWDYIVTFWEKAGESQTFQKHEKLMSRLRTNITTHTNKAVSILIRWCVLVDTENTSDTDERVLSYSRIRTPLLTNLHDAAEELHSSISTSKDKVETAGLCVILDTIRYFIACLEGTYEEDSYTYFYAPFLLSNDVILNEEYLPDSMLSDSASGSIASLGDRILSFANEITLHPVSYQDRLTALLHQHEDNFGTARLIINYLTNTEPAADYTEIQESIDDSVEKAQETASIRRSDFIGELELAQINGQIDNSSEDRKDRILRSIDDWYDWAIDTDNYGFFKKVLDEYLEEIHESGRTREAVLRKQLDSFRASSIPGLSLEEKEKRLLHIESLINEQNYTGAEDVLARAADALTDSDLTFDEDYLKDFLDNYEDYYKPVSSMQKTFSTLVNPRTRNKEERGAFRLAANWMASGNDLGKDKLKILLTDFGFSIQNIQEQKRLNGKYENYIVTTTVENRTSESYPHPIAAFGSEAAEMGFRVITIKGKFDADGIIDITKAAGSSKPTLILLDYALQKTERRRLARKIKNEASSTFFGVIDRVVMMFLVRNFDGTRMNRMLMSLIAPFAYYQPYVWNSAINMPPEIFIGRKNELESIKSPSGVNIVYGGRQLGKSALLKKAMEEVDGDNGNRAIYIEIKNKNCEETARIISHALYDNGILEEDLDTTDWSVLSRKLQNRLQSENNKIPYLLLLLDEADAFIDACADVGYDPIDELKKVQNAKNSRFKFVIAGLHDVVRFNKKVALGNNSVLTHLQSITVKPFAPIEARELMEMPLRYLGLRFPQEKQSLITLILASTNYFPGLIQMYCAKLIEAMKENNYAGYNEVDSPIYDITEEHIKKVLSDSSFMEQVREKFFITLQLGNDDYYHILALLMAYLCHTSGQDIGYSSEELYNLGCEFEIPKISNLTPEKVSAFMEELRELNVFRLTNENRYLFTRFTFFQMMGSISQVEDNLEQYMGE